MGKGTGALMGIIMVAVLFVMFPIIMDSTHELQADPVTQVEAAVVTGVGETAADVVLGNDLWADDVDSVLTITSDELTDVPVANTYTPATNTLNVTGLNEDDSRTLTITYETDALTEYTGMGALVAVAPLLIFIAVIGAVVFGAYSSFK